MKKNAFNLENMFLVTKFVSSVMCQMGRKQINIIASAADLFAAGRNTVMGDEELEIMVRDCDTDRYERLLFRKS